DVQRAPDVLGGHRAADLLFEHLPVLRVEQVSRGAAVRGRSDTPAQGIDGVGCRLGAVHRLDESVPGVVGVGRARLVRGGVAVVVVGRRESTGDRGNLVLQVAGARLGGVTVGGKARPVAGGVQAPALRVRAAGEGGELVQRVVAVLLAEA